MVNSWVEGNKEKYLSLIDPNGILFSHLYLFLCASNSFIPSWCLVLPSDFKYCDLDSPGLSLDRFEEVWGVREELGANLLQYEYQVHGY